MIDFNFKEIRCPVCGVDEPKFLGWRGGEAHQGGVGVKTAIVRCANCSHQYPNPMPFPNKSLEEVYVNAEEYFRGHDVERKKQNGLNLMSQFEQRLGKKGRALDVGCGIGEILWAAVNSGWNAEGIDTSREFIEIGKEKLGVEGKVSTLEDAHYPNNHFDAVIMSGIIEHLYEPLETLKEIHRILKPNGWFWFDAPNEDGLYMKAGNLYMRLRGNDWVVTLAPTFPPFHVQGFNVKSLKTIIKRAGFELKDFELMGEITKQSGEQTLRKQIEYNGARLINWLDKLAGKGMYMSAWVQKKQV